MLSSLSAAGLAVVLAIAGSTASDAVPQSEEQFTTTGSVTKEVTLTRWGFGLLAWYAPPQEQCPADAPYLSHDSYPGPSALTPYNAPRGVEVKALYPSDIGVTIWPALVTEEIDGETWIRQTGIGPLSSITNYRAGLDAETNWVEITLHCTN